MKKYYLLAPGPTPMSPRVLQAMTRPILHHRTKEFEQLMRSVSDDLKWLFQTEDDVLVLNATGTGAMEASVTNFLSRGDTALTINGGKFGDRWGQICRSYGVETVEIPVEWGHAVDPSQVKAALDANPNIKAVYIQASETSTGVQHPVEAIGALIKDRPQTIFVVDGVTSVGVVPLPMASVGIDVIISGSQKAFMLPPGLAFIAVSEKAWALNKRSDLPRYYFNLAKERKTQAKGQSAYTSAVSLIMGLREALNEMKEEGLENIFSRHRRLAKATRAAVVRLGCTLLGADSPSIALTAFYPPEGVSADKVKSLLTKKYNITIAGGQDHLSGKILRFAHLGYTGEFDVTTVISAFEMSLAEVGYKFTLGTGVAAALEVLSEEA